MQIRPKVPSARLSIVVLLGFLWFCSAFLGGYLLGEADSRTGARHLGDLTVRVDALLGQQPPNSPSASAAGGAAATASNGMIAFARRTPGTEGGWSLMTINPDGSGKRVLADGAFAPVWSPSLIITQGSYRSAIQALCHRALDRPPQRRTVRFLARANVRRRLLQGGRYLD